MLLDYVVLKTGRAVSYGSVTLKSLQNDNVPELDLLVREAIQNSSDASLNEEGKSYSVNFTTGIFNPSQYNSFMTDVEKILNERYPGESEMFLEIRDTKTEGLTGQIKLSELNNDDHGNFFKLVFDSGIKQANEMAGGNWGFGKSVYYRVGVGIVIYYSRIKKEDSFEDRLIITLIEDETKTDFNESDSPILNIIEKQSAGKAWWGITDGEDCLPLTDTELIQSILDVFGLQQFKNGETGTSIIIPYVDKEKLLDGILPIDVEMEDGVKDHFKQIFTSSISAYLRLSIQKWYSPKIHNRELETLGDGNKWLRVSVDGIPIRRDDIFPFFKLVQELYTTALASTNDYEYVSKEFPEIETFEIKVNNYFEQGPLAGYVSVIKISNADLTGNQPMLSPYDLIGKFETDKGFNEPIIMFARDPGMVIDYATTGAWVKGLVPSDNPDEYLFGFFVPKTKTQIKKDFEIIEYRGMRLGEYLRECEASDHMGWNDPVKMQIVQRIQKNVVNKIKEHMKSELPTTEEAIPSKLANKLGKNLLPRIGYGKKKGSGGGSGSGGGGSRSRAIEFNVLSQMIEDNKVKLNFSLSIKSQIDNVTISIMIASEAGWIDAKSWTDDIGTEFPVQIAECYIDKIKTKTSEEPYAVGASCDNENNRIVKDELQAELLSETEQLIFTQLKFSSIGKNSEILGTIILNTYDKKYQFTLRVESKEV